MPKQLTLNSKQIEILELLYKYRFGSRQLLAASLNMKPDSLYRKLELLITYKFVAKRQEPINKLMGIPAAYYLTPQGLRLLQKLPDHKHITDSLIKQSYKDKTVTQSFITQTLRVYEQTNRLKAFYPDLRIFTRRDMSQYSYFPDTLPDAFLSLKTEGEPQRFFLDIIPDSLPPKPLFQRIAQYIEFFDEGGWDITDSKLPLILLIGETGATERKIQRIARAALQKAETDEDIEIYTSTLGAVQKMEGTGSIWTSLDEPDELEPLTELQ